VRVGWIEFENLKTGLKIERIDFFEDITLLVGTSAAGKSQILNAVEYSLNLAVNKDIHLKPCCVSVGIYIEEDLYEWSYKIEAQKFEGLLLEGVPYYFSYERLYCNNKFIFERINDTIKVAGYGRVPMPKRNESLLLQYADDEKFSNLIAGIRKLYPIDTEMEVRGGIGKESFSRFKVMIKDMVGKDKDINFKVFSHLPVAVKIYITKYYYKDLYVKILEAVKELFMEIEDIDVVEDVSREMYLVSIKVYGKELLQDDISNGMLKTIYYLVELYTMSDNSLVLIDEFENGLGANCIDLLAEQLLMERDDLQFIITSHHPKIINQISKDKWKIIDRSVNIITNSGSSAYGIGNSQHDAYFNLINRWEYEGKA
jgi:predicted ATPase